MKHCLHKPRRMQRLAHDGSSRSSMVAARLIDPKRGLKQETFPMTFLVELPKEAYPANALDGFEVGSDFKLENAQAMMWLSQLAYETADKGKVDDLLKGWKLTRRAFGSNAPATGLPPKSACFVVAGGRDATVVTFSGTDPLKIQDWITDFTVQAKLDVLHQGFSDAVETVWPTIKSAIEGRPDSEKNLFFTGHSLGGALALIAAERAMRESGIRANAVYTFGGPRTGGQTFFDQYTPGLGDRTFRLVHGDDIVPTVPPSVRGNFRHVGRLLRCSHGSVFDGQTLASHDGNDPDIVQSTLNAARDVILALARLHPFSSVGPRLLDHLAGLLPTMVRDHIPASYFRALSIPLR
jgi:triacylglycerol lipase